MSVSPAVSTKSAKSSFQWDDPFLINDQLTEEERMIADAAAAFAADKLAPRVTDAYLNETTDRDIFSEMGAAGLLGVTVPEQYGGAEAGYVSYGLVAREVERVDSGYRSAPMCSWSGPSQKRMTTRSAALCWKRA